jgi:hypothetical protein
MACYGGPIKTIVTAAGASVLLFADAAAQKPGAPPRMRVNQIIEQFEQGRPSIANEH